MDEEKVISTGERSGGERHSDGHHRHSSRHRHRSSSNADLTNKRESWRKPHQKKRLRKRIASAAFAILSVIAVLLMLYVAYIYLN